MVNSKQSVINCLAKANADIGILYSPLPWGCRHPVQSILRICKRESTLKVSITVIWWGSKLWPPVKAISHQLSNAVIGLPHSPFPWGWGGGTSFTNSSLSQDLLLLEIRIGEEKDATGWLWSSEASWVASTTDIGADEKIIVDKSQSNRSPRHPHPELTDHPFWPCKYKYKCKYKCKCKYKYKYKT